MLAQRGCSTHLRQPQMNCLELFLDGIAIRGLGLQLQVFQQISPGGVVVFQPE